MTESEKAERRQYLKYLRAGAMEEADPTSKLADIACEYRDQAVQKAALAGLLKHQKDPRALTGIARRTLDSWGMSAIEQCVRVSAKAWETGGLIILGSTLFYDNRFISRKLDAIIGVLEKSNDQESLNVLRELPDMIGLFQEPTSVNGWVKRIKKVGNRDLREGVIFGTQFEGTAGWQGTLGDRCPDNELLKATEYIKSRIPGLLGVYRVCLQEKKVRDSQPESGHTKWPSPSQN
ncbi:hypothetical protein ACFL1X_05365 [Candidatus Hydrogenedentota bacterium]